MGIRSIKLLYVQRYMRCLLMIIMPMAYLSRHLLHISYGQYSMCQNIFSYLSFMLPTQVWLKPNHILNDIIWTMTNILSSWFKYSKRIVIHIISSLNLIWIVKNYSTQLIVWYLIRCENVGSFEKSFFHNVALSPFH